MSCCQNNIYIQISVLLEYQQITYVKSSLSTVCSSYFCNENDDRECEPLYFYFALCVCVFILEMAAISRKSEDTQAVIIERSVIVYSKQS